MDKHVEIAREDARLIFLQHAVPSWVCVPARYSNDEPVVSAARLRPSDYKNYYARRVIFNIEPMVSVARSRGGQRHVP